MLLFVVLVLVLVLDISAKSEKLINATMLPFVAVGAAFALELAASGIL